MLVLAKLRLVISLNISNFHLPLHRSDVFQSAQSNELSSLHPNTSGSLPVGSVSGLFFMECFQQDRTSSDYLPMTSLNTPIHEHDVTASHPYITLCSNSFPSIYDASMLSLASLLPFSPSLLSNCIVLPPSSSRPFLQPIYLLFLFCRNLFTASVLSNFPSLPASLLPTHYIHLAFPPSLPLQLHFVPIRALLPSVVLFLASESATFGCLK